MVLGTLELRCITSLITVAAHIIVTAIVLKEPVLLAGLILGCLEFGGRGRHFQTTVLMLLLLVEETRGGRSVLARCTNDSELLLDLLLLLLLLLVSVEAALWHFLYVFSFSTVLRWIKVWNKCLVGTAAALALAKDFMSSFGELRVLVNMLTSRGRMHALCTVKPTEMHKIGQFCAEGAPAIGMECSGPARLAA